MESRETHLDKSPLCWKRLERPVKFDAITQTLVDTLIMGWQTTHEGNVYGISPNEKKPDQRLKSCILIKFPIIYKILQFFLQ